MGLRYLSTIFERAPFYLAHYLIQFSKINKKNATVHYSSITTYLYYLYYNQQDNLNKLAAFWVNMNEIQINNLLQCLGYIYSIYGRFGGPKEGRWVWVRPEIRKNPQLGLFYTMFIT